MDEFLKVLGTITLSSELGFYEAEGENFHLMAETYEELLTLLEIHYTNVLTLRRLQANSESLRLATVG